MKPGSKVALHLIQMITAEQLYPCTYVSMYLSMYLCIYICIYVSIYLCNYLSMYPTSVPPLGVHARTQQIWGHVLFCTILIILMRKPVGHKNKAPINTAWVVALSSPCLAFCTYRWLCWSLSHYCAACTIIGKQLQPCGWRTKCQGWGVHFQYVCHCFL